MREQLDKTNNNNDTIENIEIVADVFFETKTEQFEQHF